MIPLRRLAFGLFLVSLGCDDKAVPAEVSANFSAPETTILAGTTVTFEDLSSGGTTSWKWEFEGGTPASSTVNLPSIKYQLAGTYDVSLTTSNGDNTDNERKADYITVLGVVDADFSLSKSLAEANSPVTFTDLSKGLPTQWEWSFPGGTPSTSNAKNPTITYATDGVYNVTLTASNALSSDIVTKSEILVVLSPVSFYKLDGNTNDSGPLSLTGTAHGAILTTDRKGSANAAYHLDGINDYIEMPYNSMADDFPITVSFWIRLDNVNGSILASDFNANVYSGISFVTSKVAGTFNHLGLSFGNGGPINPDSRRTLVTNFELLPNQWYHIVGVFSSTTTMIAYVNGVNVPGTYSGNSTTYVHLQSFGALGKTGNLTDLFNGSIDDFRIYQKVLSPTEIALLFAQ